MNRLIVFMIVFLSALGGHAQSITGVVKDAADGSPVIGVSVFVQGTTNGTVTDAEGKFNLKATKKDVLQFKYIGYATQTVEVGNKTHLVITLAQNVTNMNEVVVTALGIKREKKALGYAMTSLKGDDLVKAGNPANPVESLYGQAPGVRIASTAGGPQAAMAINIRGAVSLNQNESTRPLIIVDGIPIQDNNTEMGSDAMSGRATGTGLNDINPSDIASLDVLKGAKAAVLYGSAGANGVILITTKSGSKKRGLGVSANVSYSNVTIMSQPDWQNEFGSGSGIQGNKADEVDANGFFYSTGPDGKRVKTWQKGGSDGGESFGPKMDGSQVLWWNGKMQSYSPQPNNYRDLFQTGHQTQANVVMQNGNEKGNYRASYTIKNGNM